MFGYLNNLVMKRLKIIRIVSWTIAILIGLTSSYGLFFPEAYYDETSFWAVQAMGQDLINLFIIPFYLFSAQLINQKKNGFSSLWTGITGYFIYTFLIYSFYIPFNGMLLLNISILGLLIYSLFILLYSNKNKLEMETNSFPDQLTGTYFIFTSILFCGWWFSEILPANLFNKTPENLEFLSTNPVHVLDLSIVLPGIFIGGILLIRRKRPGHFLAPMILTFSLLMQLTIGVLMLLLNEYAQQPSEIVWFTFVLATISLSLLVFNLRNSHIAL